MGPLLAILCASPFLREVPVLGQKDSNQKLRTYIKSPRNTSRALELSFGFRSARADAYPFWKGGWVEPLTPTPRARCTTVRVLERSCLSAGQQVCPLCSDTEVRKVGGRKVSTEAPAGIQVQTDKGLAQNCFCKTS